MKIYFNIIIALVLLVPNLGFAENWDSVIKGVRTCQQPNGSATLIQIDFENGKSLVWTGNDSKSMLFKNYMNTVMTALTTKRRVDVSNANPHISADCTGIGSTHINGLVNLNIINPVMMAKEKVSPKEMTSLLTYAVNDRN